MKNETKRQILLYIHGKGGSAAECEHYKPLFPEYDVFGLDYQTFTPWETGAEIRSAVENAPGYDPETLPITVLDDFKETVLAAADYAQNGDVVILSPACSSFDRFKNFAERGNTFRKIVEELK